MPKVRVQETKASKLRNGALSKYTQANPLGTGIELNGFASVGSMRGSKESLNSMASHLMSPPIKVQIQTIRLLIN